MPEGLAVAYPNQEQPLMQLLGKGPLAPFQQAMLAPGWQLVPSQQQQASQRWQVFRVEQQRQLVMLQVRERQVVEDSSQPEVQLVHRVEMYWLQVAQPMGQGLQVRMVALRQYPPPQALQSQALLQLTQFNRQVLQLPEFRQYPAWQDTATTTDEQLTAFSTVHRLQAELPKTQGSQQTLHTLLELHCWQLSLQELQVVAQERQYELEHVEQLDWVEQALHSWPQGRQLVLLLAGHRDSCTVRKVSPASMSSTNTEEGAIAI